MSKPKPITLEDFAAWKDNAITQAFFAHLKAVEAHAHAQWIALLGGEIPADPRPMQLTQVELKAKLEFIQDALAIELSDIQEEEENASQIEQRIPRSSRRPER
jgi:hypothetical protein